MRLINVETRKLEEFFDDKVPPYAILSHTWGAPGEEVSFHDIQTGNIEERAIGARKLEECCKKVKESHLGYVWIDTCCINKESSTELGEAINSMFQWYKKASICYAYLSDVPPGDSSWDPASKFFASRWFLRGWTLQELLAPKKLYFYDQIWKSIGTKEDMSNEIEKITGIPQQFLLGWEDFRSASVAQRMSWAAKRKTTRREDTAYCLLGIFDVTMPMIYGEGNRALSRLQQEIMKDTSDYSILAWGLPATKSKTSKSSDIVSAGVLATSPSDFANCGTIVSRKRAGDPIDIFDISGGRLRVRISLHTTSDGELYGLLNCGPEHNLEQIVGIPLYKTASGVPSDEYLRPQGRHPILLPKTTSTSSANAIHVRMERQSRAHKVASQRYWLRIDGHRKIRLELNDVYPPISWEEGRALIAEATDPNAYLTRRYLVRFRAQGEGSRDFVVALELEMQGLRAQARCHVMTSARDTALEDLWQKLIYMRPKAFEKRTASSENVSTEVTVEVRHIAQEPMFAVSLVQAPSSPETTVYGTWELQHVNLKFEFLTILLEEDEVRLEMERLNWQRHKKKAALDQMRERLTVVEENLWKLVEEKKSLTAELKKGTQQLDELTSRHDEARREQEKLSARESEIQRRLDENELETEQGPGNWLETIIMTLLDAGKIDRGLKDVQDSDFDCPQLSRAVEGGHNNYGQTPLSWAKANGHYAVVRLLLEKGTGIGAKTNNGKAPLSVVTGTGHQAWDYTGCRMSELEGHSLAYEHHSTSPTVPTDVLELAPTTIEPMPPSATRFIAIGIDFGITYSSISWAFSRNQMDVRDVRNYPRIGTALGADEEKVPTRYDQRTGAWGYLLDKSHNEPTKWFKLLLLRDEDIREDIRNSPYLQAARLQTSVWGEDGPVHIVANFLRELWQHCLRELKLEFDTMALENLPFKVALTVPDIWPQYARQKIKAAAQRAGILAPRNVADTRLTLVEESEAAAMATLFDRRDNIDIGVDETFVLCDYGGNTIDIIGYKVVDAKPFVFRKATQGDSKLCGASMIKNNFRDYIKHKSGLQFQNCDPADFDRLVSEEWEYTVRPFAGDDDREEFFVTAPVKAFPWSARLRGSNKIRLKKDTVISFFEDTLQGIRELINGQYQKIVNQDGKPPKIILLVGGLDSSRYLFRKLEAEYGNVMRAPRDWSVAAHGAVIKLLKHTFSQDVMSPE